MAVPGSLPKPPLVCRTTLAPNRIVCRLCDQDTVSASCTWRLNRSDDRDSPIVNGTDPARVYVVESSCASQSETGSPFKYETRASLRRFGPIAVVWFACVVHERRVYRRATVGAFVPTTASFGFVSNIRSTLKRSISVCAGASL